MDPPVKPEDDRTLLYTLTQYSFSNLHIASRQSPASAGMICGNPVDPDLLNRLTRVELKHYEEGT